MYLNYLEKEEFEGIMLENLRELFDINQKILVSTLSLIFLQDDYLTADLMYKDESLDYFIQKGNKYFQDLDINEGEFKENLFEYYKNENLDNAFLKTRNALKIKIESKDSGYFKALFDKDGWAAAVQESSDFFMDLYSVKKLTAGNIKQFTRMLRKNSDKTLVKHN